MQSEKQVEIEKKEENKGNQMKSCIGKEKLKMTGGGERTQ